MPIPTKRIAEVIGDLICKIESSGYLPHIIIANGDGVQFPPHLASLKTVAFNVSAMAVFKFFIDGEGVSFSGRFGGKEHVIYSPLRNIAEVYALGPDKKVIQTFELRQIWDENLTDVQLDSEENEPEEVESMPAHRAKLTLLEGGGKGDGKPTGRLRLAELLT